MNGKNVKTNLFVEYFISLKCLLIDNYKENFTSNLSKTFKPHISDCETSFEDSEKENNLLNEFLK